MTPSNNTRGNSLDKFCHYRAKLVSYSSFNIFNTKNISMGVTNSIVHLAIEETYKKHSIYIFTKEVMDNYVHLFVNCPLQYSIL